jgi:Uma2 family endonuclease
MTTVRATSRKGESGALPPLEDGMRLTQAEFHRRYLAYPDKVKAELIGGTVYMASPLGRRHGTHHPELSGIFFLYKAATPGVEVLDNATTILGEASEPQPDLTLRILPEWGGRSQTTPEDYVQGGSELLAEISHRTRRLDLDLKRLDYQQAGVREYLVWCLEPPELHWFDFTCGKPLKPDRQGIYRSRVFPGLWIARQALLDCDTLRLIAVLQQGLASRAHAAFVKRLQAAHRKLSGN